MSVESFAFDFRCQLFYGFQFPAGGNAVEDFVEHDAYWAIGNFVALSNCVGVDIQIRHPFSFVNVIDGVRLHKPLWVARVAVLGEKISDVLTTEWSRHIRDCTLYLAFSDKTRTPIPAFDFGET